MLRDKTPRTVLVADDHDDTRQVVRWMLELRGYCVVEVADGQDVVETALRERPDLILMDLKMPNVDGFDALQQIKEHRELSDLPVVAVTARDMAELRDRAEFAGFDYYLSKPLDFLRLDVVIEKLLDGKPLRRPADGKLWSQSAET